jgi:hypothetical protein
VPSSFRLKTGAQFALFRSVAFPPNYGRLDLSLPFKGTSQRGLSSSPSSFFSTIWVDKNANGNFLMLFRLGKSEDSGRIVGNLEVSGFHR